MEHFGEAIDILDSGTETDVPVVLPGGTFVFDFECCVCAETDDDELRKPRYDVVVGKQASLDRTSCESDLSTFEQKLITFACLTGTNLGSDSNQIMVTHVDDEAFLLFKDIVGELEERLFESLCPGVVRFWIDVGHGCRRCIDSLLNNAIKRFEFICAG